MLIVGCGLFGAVIARLLTNNGVKCNIIDKRSHIGGNCYTENYNGIHIHKYGPHIFHTSNKQVWNFVNKYSYFNTFVLNTLAFDGNGLYHLPFNLDTHVNFHPKQIQNPQNLEEKALSQIGEDAYYRFVKYYTEKQWNKKCTELSPEIISRIPVRNYYNNNYFNDLYQGIPENGYTQLILNILNGIDKDGNKIEEPIQYKLNCDYSLDSNEKTIYCGQIDRLFNYCLGELEWRSLKFENNIGSQKTAIINYCNKDVPYTRTVEHLYFMPHDFIEKYNKESIITTEYPQKWNVNLEPYYPGQSIDLYNKYKEMLPSNIILGGRLGLYKYLDMDDTIINAFECYEKL